MVTTAFCPILGLNDNCPVTELIVIGVEEDSGEVGV